MSFGKKVREAGNGLNALLVIGFLIVVWLMIYGNLSGNYGFNDRTTASAVNETVTLVDSGAVLAAGSGKDNPVLTITSVVNATNGSQIITTANYTTSGGSIFALAGVFNNTLANVTYSVAYDGVYTTRTNNVNRNITGGTITFAGFSGTLFTIMAIVLLITILLALLAIVMKISKIGSKGSGGSGFKGNIG